LPDGFEGERTMLTEQLEELRNLKPFERNLIIEVSKLSADVRDLHQITLDFAKIWTELRKIREVVLLSTAVNSKSVTRVMRGRATSRLVALLEETISGSQTG
jgi:hypothetical protein